MTCKSLCSSVGGVALCIALGGMLSGFGIISPRRPTPPVNPSPRPQQPSVVTPRRIAPTYIRIDNVNYVVSAFATRTVGGAPLDEAFPPLNTVQVTLRITRADGRPITRDFGVPTLLCTQGGVTTNVPLERAPIISLLPSDQTRTFIGPGSLAWANDVQIMAQVRVQGLRSVSTARIPVPMNVVVLPIIGTN